MILNGPRHFLMDSATGDPGRVRSFDGLRMRKVATIPIRTADELVPRAYSERTIERHNTWTWEAGRRVYELLAPDGSDYVMQSYSQIRDPQLSIGRLRSLGDRLELPQGWRYRSRVLKRDLTLVARGKATIVQDDLTNTYQRLPRESDAERHRVDVAGSTRTVDSPSEGTLHDQGTVSGEPFGDGTIDLVVTFGENSTATGTFTIDAKDGSAFGTVEMTYVISGNEIDFTGTADFTGGTGELPRDQGQGPGRARPQHARRPERDVRARRVRRVLAAARLELLDRRVLGAGEVRGPSPRPRSPGRGDPLDRAARSRARRACCA